MTAGIAAASPMAVAISASEIPGATTARLALPVCPILWKELMIPQTVPKRPMKGPVLPVVASQFNFDSKNETSFSVDLRITRSRLSTLES